MTKVMTEMAQAKDNEMSAEYDFTAGVRDKHYGAMRAGYTITVHKSDGTTVVKDLMPKKGTVVLEPDIQAYFPDSKSVNRALQRQPFGSAQKNRSGYDGYCVQKSND